jgi:hypothetical protein
MPELSDAHRRPDLKENGMWVYVVCDVNREARGFRERRSQRSYSSFEEACRERDRANEESAQEGRAARYEVAEVDVTAAVVEVEAKPRALASVFLKRMAHAAQSEFLLGCRFIFEEHPGLQSFAWPQGWVDWEGMEEYFEYEGCDPGINGLSRGEFEEWPALERGLRGPVSKFLGELDPTLMEALFGDGVTVTVHRDGRVETVDDGGPRYLRTLRRW